ncbi:hypothetical protein AKJ51_00900 [candidate division MSBL1 archaeon SCGC-AAA382A20]|uniref:Pyrroline-5-carboxylate reductase n=1 Tax=candidate division MSBL1 archaeon SCGC-AAA382A20 TaxID=1698280 RepID=A0A133VMB2_9EURY|nr:hypothetical protein AKJ51_00900 [candidate division MSBL1 archaeon SCGC-AAA382A20]
MQFFNQDMHIVFIGGGTIAKAIYEGLESKHDVTVIKKNLEEEYWKGKVELSPAGEYVKGDVYIIAVKPSVFQRATEPFIGMEGTFISVMAGVSIDKVKNYLETEEIVRCMPNLPVAIGEGFIPYTPLSEEAEKDFKEIFHPLGSIKRTDEEYLDPLTALTGTSPLYVSVFIDALIDSGIKIGLPKDIARKAAIQCTIAGSRYLQEKEIHPMAFKDMVSSPGGTSIYALHNLEKRGLKAAIIESVEIANERAQKLRSMLE